MDRPDDQAREPAPENPPLTRTRRRLHLGPELLLASLPMGVALVELTVLEQVSRQHILYASLASSALTIYRDPLHRSNSVGTILKAHGLATWAAFGHTYMAAAAALVATTLALVVLDVVHPPAIATSLTFAFRVGEERTWVFFVMALAVIASLVVLERAMLWLLARLAPD